MSNFADGIRALIEADVPLPIRFVLICSATADGTIIATHGPVSDSACEAIQVLAGPQLGEFMYQPSEVDALNAVSVGVYLPSTETP